MSAPWPVNKGAFKCVGKSDTPIDKIRKGCCNLPVAMRRMSKVWRQIFLIVINSRLQSHLFILAFMIRTSIHTQTYVPTVNINIVCFTRKNVLARKLSRQKKKQHNLILAYLNDFSYLKIHYFIRYYTKTQDDIKN